MYLFCDLNLIVVKRIYFVTEFNNRKQLDQYQIKVNVNSSGGFSEQVEYMVIFSKEKYLLIFQEFICF